MRQQRRQKPRFKKSDKKCSFCQKKTLPDYKEVEALRQFTTDRGKIIGRSRTGLCQKHQRRLAQAIKRVRHLALLPFVVTE